MIGKALASNETLSAAAAGSTGGGEGPTARRPRRAAASGGWRGVLKGVYQNLMTGVSYMLPFIVAGGLLIAISFAFDIDANDPDLPDSFAGRLLGIGSAAFALFLPGARRLHRLLHRRPARASRRASSGGYLAVQVNAGFLGALLAGFIAGYLTKFLAQHIKLPTSMQGLKPVLDPAAAGDAGHRAGHVLRHRRADLVGAGPS